MEEWIKEIRLQINERTSSPLLASFLVSWCIWNYKFIVILFSDASLLTTFYLIEKISFPSYKEAIGYGFIAPLTTSLLYLYAYPTPAKLVYEHWQKKQKEILEIRQKIEDETPLTIAQSRQIRFSMSNLVDEHNKEIERKDAEIERLKSSLSAINFTDKKNEISKIIEKTPAQSHKLTDSQISLIKKIGEAGGALESTDFPKTDTFDFIKTEFDLGEISNKGLIQIIQSNHGPIYRLTHEGKGLLIDLSKN